MEEQYQPIQEKPEAPEETAVADETQLTSKQLAAGMGYSIQTIDSWRRKNRGPKWVKKGYRGVRYNLSDVEAFIEETPGFEFNLDAALSAE